ncbi:MAG: decaprenyl-phosphate phosphoribosyltransferase [Phycisphaerae bacterium]|nr:decaprenyl-phosphate phosphoribosyltransferase [Phycisphaerae bacterium]
MADSIESGTSSATPRDLIALLRPQQWVKNVVVFAGPAAGLKLSSIEGVLNACVAFVAFCFAASSIYALNDTIDREVDARHPTKRHRPIARGAISPTVALILAGALAASAFALTALLVNLTVTAILALYLITMIAYSLALKERVILDVILLASGFVMRAWAGAASVDLVTSEWLVACVFTICLFFGFGKRRCESTMIGDGDAAGEHRKTLVRYTPQLLTHLIAVSAAIAIVTFLLYTVEPSRSPTPFHKEYLFYTLPIVVYGVFRFAMLTELGIYAGPTEIILKDRMMVAAIVVWGAIALGIAYHDPIVRGLGMENWVWGPPGR